MSVRYRASHKYPHEYMQAPVEIDIAPLEGTNYIAGYARRMGVTPPGYPDRAVYQLSIHGQKTLILYVYEDGEFIPSEEWHRKQVTL